MGKNILLSQPDLVLVGVGPGDPSLLTLAAVEAIKNATMIAFPIANEGAESLAEKIASNWIAKEQVRLPLLFPMVKDPNQLKKAWRIATDQIAMAVQNGEKVAFLCQGDSSLYASSSYVLIEMQLRHPECSMQVIPGITSIGAAAAIGAWPLTMQQDQLLILPTPDSSKVLQNLLEEANSTNRVLALLKLGHRWKWVRPILESNDLLGESLFAERIGFPDQKVLRAVDVSAKAPTYFSLLLVRQNWPDVIA